MLNSYVLKLGKNKIEKYNEKFGEKVINIKVAVNKIEINHNRLNNSKANNFLN